MIHKWVARMMLVNLTPILALPFDIANTAEAPFIGVLMRLNDGVTLDDLIAEVATDPMGMLPPVTFLPLSPAGAALCSRWTHQPPAQWLRRCCWRQPALRSSGRQTCSWQRRAVDNRYFSIIQR
jgi:hypothetical protein